MVKRRSRFMPGFQSRFMPAPRPLPSTRSSVRATTFAPVSSRYAYDDIYVPHRPSVLPHYSYDTSGSEYATASDINRELIMSSAAMEDNFDISARSRQRDKDVLAAANRAIVDTEVHSTPKGAVAAMRVTRGQSSPPAPTNVTRTKVHVAIARASPSKLRYSVPPASVPHRRPRFPRVTVRPRYRYWFPARVSGNQKPVKMAREPSPDIEGLRRAPLSLLAYLRNLELALLSEHNRPRSTYVPVRSAYKKAALLANKVEVNLPTRKRSPRSSYAQAKLRQMRKEKQRDDVDVEPVVFAEVTSGLKAHAPVYDPTFGKPYWGVEGVRKPNIMSWQYRLDTYASPDDLIIVPRSLNAVRSQLREAHDKLDHHKQLVDRYLVADKGFSVEDSIALAASKAHLGERA